MKLKKSIVLIASILILSLTLLCGCTKENKDVLEYSDLVGYWVSTSGYNAENQVVDTVFQFIDDKQIAVSSYFDGGKTIYNYEVQESTDTTITILIDDEINKPTEIKFVDENTIEYKSSSDDDTISLTKIDQEEAEEFIEKLEKFATY